MKRFDVAVIGAGPAGSSAAISLARLGYGVALIDKQRFPREKLCGDFVSPINIPLLRTVGIEQELLAQPHEAVGTFRITSPLGTEVRIPLASPADQASFGWGLSRRTLDHLLVQKAAAQGVSVFEGSKIRQMQNTAGSWRLMIDNSTAAEAFTASMLVGADGRNSWVAQRLGLGGKSALNGLAAGFQLRLHAAGGCSGNVEIHLFSGGYAGVVGLGDGTLNLCLAVTKMRLPDRQVVQHLLRSCLPENPWLRDLLTRSSIAGETRSVYPVYFPPRRCYAEGALLVGDAARVNEPVSGEGIYFAIKSGMMAADAIDQAFQNGDRSAAQLSSYARECRRAFRKRRAINSLIRWLVYRPALVEPLMRSSSLSRRVLAPFVHAICTP